ncbi:hypothetical protein EW146_g3219 [Bondarzewia mesenterica]|uniref:Asl1-like glycosyl hydrolase catalytic domain-containing protein n=1 Tax=Bondarzewia mesenterica TaxID=1095465 RepID=A0A4S4LY62_9AGAM|nr:hypothetical protein EW146_g3219 [Bondarzewia mesenterica]
MAAFNFLNLLTISTLAIFASSFSATPVNAIASPDHHHLGRSLARGHDSIAKRKRDTSSKRCKTRSSTLAPAPSTTAVASSIKVVTTPTAQPKATSSSSSSTAVATTSASSSGSTGSGKGGLAWPNGDEPSLKNFKTSKVNFIYTWTVEYPSSSWSLGLEPIPMLWGESQATDFQNKVVKGYANIAFGFNEPNEPGQSNIQPDRGAELWKQYLAPLKSQGYELGSPATSSNPNGLVWVKNFLSACNGGCEFDYTCVHWYDVKAADFITYVELWHTTFNKPIMVTEYACQNFNGGAQCTQDEIFSFMATVNGWMDGTDYVKAYFPFGVMRDMSGVNVLDGLMTNSGTPTDLGYLFINP